MPAPRNKLEGTRLTERERGAQRLQQPVNSFTPLQFSSQDSLANTLGLHHWATNDWEDHLLHEVCSVWRFARRPRGHSSIATCISTPSACGTSLPTQAMPIKHLHLTFVTATHYLQHGFDSTDM